MSVGTYDQVIGVVRLPTDSADLDRLCDQFAQTLTLLREEYVQIAQELLAMYESAAEHNLDVSRQAVYNLAQRMLQ